MVRKILYIEDDVLLSSLVNITLTKKGYEINTVPTAEQALETIKIFTPDIILLDIILPGMTGLQFLEIFRNKEQFKNTRVIVFTNLNRTTDIEQAEKLNAEFFIKAELTPDQLPALLEAK
ncbi:MAG: response regulator [Candidatus Paceibacterota bacterium]|jgi:CheY-like chemotaxis protein